MASCFSSLTWINILSSAVGHGKQGFRAPLPLELMKSLILGELVKMPYTPFGVLRVLLAPIKNGWQLLPVFFAVLATALHRQFRVTKL